MFDFNSTFLVDCFILIIHFKNYFATILEYSHQHTGSITSNQSFNLGHPAVTSIISKPSSIANNEGYYNHPSFTRIPTIISSTINTFATVALTTSTANSDSNWSMDSTTIHFVLQMLTIHIMPANSSSFDFDHSNILITTTNGYCPTSKDLHLTILVFITTLGAFPDFGTSFGIFVTCVVSFGFSLNYYNFSNSSIKTFYHMDCSHLNFHNYSNFGSGKDLAD